MRHLISVAALTLTIACGAAQAQVDFGDSDEPIRVKAEKATYKGNVTVLHENVDVQQGSARIMANRMEIFRKKRESDVDAATGSLSLGAVTKIVATGNFKYTTPQTTVTGKQGTYYRDRGVIIVTDNVRVKQPNGSFVTGEKMVYDLKNGRVKFGEECETENCTGRVSIRIE